MTKKIVLIEQLDEIKLLENFIDENNRIRIILPHSSGSKVNLILRHGKLLNELRNETKENKSAY